MTVNPQDLKYAPTHEWVRIEEKIAVCGITDHAQRQLTDIVFVELPAAGRILKAGERAALVESVKSVSDIYAPVSGTVTAVNDQVKDSPELVNQDAFGSGWLFKIEMSDPAEIDRLLTLDAYRKRIEGDAR